MKLIKVMLKKYWWGKKKQGAWFNIWWEIHKLKKRESRLYKKNLNSLSKKRLLVLELLPYLSNKS